MSYNTLDNQNHLYQTHQCHISLPFYDCVHVWHTFSRNFQLSLVYCKKFKHEFYVLSSNSSFLGRSIMSTSSSLAALTGHIEPSSLGTNDTSPLYVMLERLALLDVIALDAAVSSGLAGERAHRLLAKRRRIAPHCLPALLIAAHNDEEYQRAQEAAQRFGPLVDSVHVIREKGRNDTAVNALALHRQYWPQMAEQERKTRLLLLGRRGGGGKPQFIAPFVGGAGTTCGAWTPIVAYQQGKTMWIAGTRSQEEERQATPIRGFLRGNYAQGVCPAECSFCYLRGLQGMGIKGVSLNLEDAIPELDRLPRGSVVNWAELGGPVEEDPWFVDEHGKGSLVQTILDLATERGIVSFFLTKGVYEPYLQLQDRLALFAISLNAPEISSIFEPG